MPVTGFEADNLEKVFFFFKWLRADNELMSLTAWEEAAL